MRRINEAGNTHGRLTVTKEAERKRGLVTWLCKCTCGNQVTVTGIDLRSGHTKSCGCLWREISTTHGLSNSPEYRSWKALIQRCTNTTKPRFKDYGGRGINVCNSWRKFENFYADMGPRPSLEHSIDRIDNDGDYAPENCQWATVKQQHWNRRNSILLTYKNKTQCMVAWSEELGLNYSTLTNRLIRGWSVERALATPSGKYTKKPVLPTAEA